MDSYLPADFFIVEESAFVSGLRDWSKPRGPYPGSRHRPRHSRESGNPGAMRREVPHLGPRLRGDDDEEWHPL